MEVASDHKRRGMRDRLSLHSAHLGTDPAATSAYSLCGARRWSVPGSHPLDLVASPLLRAGQVLSATFRDKFVEGLEQAHLAGKLSFSESASR